MTGKRVVAQVAITFTVLFLAEFPYSFFRCLLLGMTVGVSFIVAERLAAK